MSTAERGLTEEWLREKYNREGMTQEEIAEIADTHQPEVSKALKRHGVTSHNEPHQSEEWLWDNYWNEQMTMAEMGEEAGVSDYTILYWMRKHGIKTR